MTPGYFWSLNSSDIGRPEKRLRTSAHTAGRISAGLLVFLGSALLLLVIGAIYLSNSRRSSSGKAEPLVVYCAAGLKPAAEAVAREYEQAYGTPVQLQYGGSQTLLAQIEVSRRGDLYLPGDDSYIAAARDRGLIEEVISVARMSGVLVVARGNPKNIRSLEDLKRGDIKLAQANPDAAAIGKLVRQALQPTGLWEPIQARTTVFKPTVNDVANDLKLRTVDAGFIWDAMLPQYPELEVVSVAVLSNVQARIALTVLKSAAKPAAALRFARFMAARDKGLPHWQRLGYSVESGDAWAEAPELRVFSGAMLRPAVEKTITDFEQREGVVVRRVYNGCGILVSQMRAGQVPDAYFACDASFMKSVEPLFRESVTVSANPMVILAGRGNPRKIQSVDDLARSGLRLGLAHEEQSALGALTRNLLQSLGRYDAIKTNVVVYSATGDFLVNQLRTGSLDAVIVYYSNGAALTNDLTIIPIQIPSALATQPIAVSRETRFAQLAERLRQRLVSAESKVRFLEAGFQWQADASVR